jgi:cell division protein FtsW (lipid II flippase)
VLIFYLVLFYRGYQIAARIAAPFGRLLATGIVTTLAFQTLLNIGGVVKALPLTGITLPFISHGGTSLLTSFIGVGLLLAISERETETRKIIERPKANKPKKKRQAGEKV